MNECFLLYDLDYYMNSCSFVYKMGEWRNELYHEPVSYSLPKPALIHCFMAIPGSCTFTWVDQHQQNAVLAVFRTILSMCQPAVVTFKSIVLG